VSGEYEKKRALEVRILYSSNTVGCCGVSIDESLKEKRRVRAIFTWAKVPF
jgi:hypothetical protein